MVENHINLLKKYRLRKYTTDVAKQFNEFDCGDEDLNDFFKNDANDFDKEMLGKSYCFTHKKDIICIFTISNDAIKRNEIPADSYKEVKKDIPKEKPRLRSYPAVLIGRLGVKKNFEGQGIGTQVMDFIKAWIASEKNKTGCRFLVVDAYNNEKGLRFYKKYNDFVYLIENEKSEAEYLNIKLKDGEHLHTRKMYFDLKKVRKL